MPQKRKVGRPRKYKRKYVKRRAPVRRRAPAMSGGQLGALMPLVKFIAPLVLGEAAKFGISTGLRKLRGKGLTPAGGRGLRLAGQGHKRPYRRRKPRMQVMPYRGMKMPYMI